MNKKELRKELIRRRREMDKNYREEICNLIYNKLIGLPEIIKAEVILTYVSTEIEVDTVKFIKKMLEAGKTVAVPKCEGKNMRFIKISDLDSLKTGAFEIPEPVGDNEITDFKNSVCITPALAFNENGFRLGYGGGYYDRFAESYNGVSVGICYEEFIGEIPLSEYDLPVKILITEKKTRVIRNEV